MRRIVLTLAVLLAWPAVSQAHFLWLLHDQATGKGQVYFSESAEPDDPALLEKVTKAQVWMIAGQGEPKLLPLTKTAESLETSAESGLSQSPIILRHSYGVMAKGGDPFLLNYYAKTYPSSLPGTWRSVKDTEHLPLEVTPSLDGKSTALKVQWKGNVLAGATVTVVGPGIDKKLEGTTDEAGIYRCELPQAGTYSIRAKHTEEVAGKLEDKEYKSVKSYSTLTLHYEPKTVAPEPNSLPEMPKGVTSFGGAVAGETLFVYGGNYGGAHEYRNEDQSGDLWTLNLKSPAKWEKIEGGPKRQGVAMVEYKGAIYRIGGFVATNGDKEKQDLRSQDDVAKFNSASSKWEPLPNLPGPRSSHDAAMIGDTLYVVGGWNMQGGGSGAKWHDTALAMNLAAEKLEWKPIAAPGFERRALAIAAWEGKLVCIGGMQHSGGPTTETAVYDPASDKWTPGASLLGSSMDGFGSSAFACHGKLYTTTSSGSIQCLSDDGKHWKFLGQVEQPRFFHRVLPWGDSKLLVVGGASMDQGKATKVEVLTFTGSPTLTKASE
jgi:N-acetylneuraminic acid mutarotase